jgi:hypothetical protein
MERAMKTHSIVTVLVLALASLPAAAAGSPGKPTAPVRVLGTVAGTRANLQIHFDDEVQNAQVRIYGTDGLTVQGEPLLLRDGHFAAGQEVSLASAIQPGPGRSYLAVQVTGTFHGARRTLVRSFRVGTPSAAQLERDRAGLTRDSHGQLVRVAPAQLVAH